MLCICRTVLFLLALCANVYIKVLEMRLRIDTGSWRGARHLIRHIDSQLWQLKWYTISLFDDIFVIAIDNEL